MNMHQCENCKNLKREDTPTTSWWELGLPYNGNVCLSNPPTFDQLAREKAPLHFCGLKCLETWLKNRQMPVGPSDLTTTIPQS